MNLGKEVREWLIMRSRERITWKYPGDAIDDFWFHWKKWTKEEFKFMWDHSEEITKVIRFLLGYEEI